MVKSTAHYIYRMLTPDSIVPDPANPQSFNRYSYVRNNPVNFTDPTGHRECEFEGVCAPEPSPFSSLFFNFIGDIALAEKQMAHQAASAIGQQMANTVNSSRRMEAKMEGTSYSSLSAEEAFLGVFGGPITLRNEDKDLVDNGGFSVYAIASETETMITIGNKEITNHYLLIHEIFHIFDIVMLGGAANQTLWNDYQNVPGSTFPNRPTLSGDSDLKWGFAGGNFSPWQKSRSGASGEEFADMGIGWTYGRWETNALGALTTDGQDRADFMSQHMLGWILQAMGQ